MNPDKFSVGALNSPGLKDPEFDTAEAARSHAEGRSLLDNRTVFAVWRNDGGEVLFVIHDGQVYVPE